ncbi:MAG: hypothetical protein H7Y36_00805 [Armatimonadetes bacterium]|nr:hypothetical protein [Akkermansiaceae bacterium]
MSTIFQAAPEAPSRPHKRSIGDIVELCLVRTADALSATDSATDTQIFKALSQVRESNERGHPLDLIDNLARVLGHDEEHIAPVILSLSDAVASTLNPAPPVIPFASKLIAPSTFYESFDTMHKLGRALLAPVIFAEDTDAIGTASINPIAAIMLGEEIHASVSKRFGIRPFISTARMEYESWAFLCRKHFEL